MVPSTIKLIVVGNAVVVLYGNVNTRANTILCCVYCVCMKYISSYVEWRFTLSACRWHAIPFLKITIHYTTMELLMIFIWMIKEDHVLIHIFVNCFYHVLILEISIELNISSHGAFGISPSFFLISVSSLTLWKTSSSLRTAKYF